MNIQTERLEDHQIKLLVEADAADWEKAKRQAARKLAKRVKIPGFRPGKAPYPVIVKHLGEAAITEEGLDILVDEIYPRILEEAEVEPYGPGRLEDVTSFDPPTLEFIVPLKPKVELGDYKSLKLPYEPPEVSDEDVEAVIENLRERSAASEAVERPAEEGDVVYLRVSAKRLDIEDEEDATLYSGQFSSARLGEENSASDRQFFEGFSKHLYGLAPQEEKTFTHTYPEDYIDEELRGVEVEFHVLVTNVQSLKLPELNDEFAQEVSEFETLEELRADIREHLEEQALGEYLEEYSDEVVEKLVESSTIHFPPQAVEHEKHHVLNNLEMRLSQQGLTLDLYKEFSGQSAEEFEADLARAAEHNVKRELVLAEVARAEEIEPDPEKFNQASTTMLNTITAEMTPKQVRDLQKKGDIANLLSHIAIDLTFQRTVEYLTTIARGEPWPPENESPEDQTESETEAEAPAAEEQPAPEAEAAPPIPDDESEAA